MIKDKNNLEFNNTLHKSLSKLYTYALHKDCSTLEEYKEVRRSLRYIVKWCIKHGADIPDGSKK